jgi:hypothetical protein
VPRFLTKLSPSSVIPDGVYVVKVTKATEKVSERGNEMIVMTLSLPDGRSLSCILTFVEAARLVINAFCSSADLVKPLKDEIEVELTARHCLGRYLYITVVNDAGEVTDDPAPHVSRFLTREQALTKNPALAQIKLEPQEPLVLPVIRTGGFKS